MTRPASPISIRRVSPADERASIRRLLQENLPEAVTGDRFDWAYLDNPDGAAWVWLAETEDGEAVGTSAAFPRQFRVDGQAIAGLVLSDFAIDRRYRTLGPAIALLRATLAPVDDGSFGLALDHPSESMLAVYRRLGGVQLGQLTRHVRLLSAGGAATRRWGAGLRASVVGTLGDLAIRTADRFRSIPGGMDVDISAGIVDGGFAALGRQLEERGAVCGERSPEYLSWRYRGGSRFEYLTVSLRSGNDLLGYAILQQTRAGIITIVEFVCPADNAIEVALSRAILKASRIAGAEAVQASCIAGGAWCAVLERLGFAAREHSSGPVVYSAASATWTDKVTDGNHWWMTDGDRDG